MSPRQRIQTNHPQFYCFSTFSLMILNLARFLLKKRQVDYLRENRWSRDLSFSMVKKNADEKRNRESQPSKILC